MTATDEAIILAGGLGTRLRSVVSGVPKALAQVNGRPFVAYLLDALATQGFSRVILATGYLGEMVEAVLGDRWHDMHLVYSREPQPLGTGGAVVLAAQHVHGAACFVLNGDTYLHLDYTDFDSCAQQSNLPLAMALANVPETTRYGAVEVDGDRVVGFAEKRRSGPGYINAGAYRIECNLVAGQPAGAALSFERDVLRPAAKRGGILAYTQTRGFIDIGVPEDFARAQRLLGVGGATAC